MNAISRENSGSFHFVMVGDRAALTEWISSVRPDDLMRVFNGACPETTDLPPKAKENTQRERKSYKCSILAFQDDNYRA